MNASNVGQATSLPSAKPLRVAVIGVGHLGRIHARLLNSFSPQSQAQADNRAIHHDARLVAIADPSEPSRTAVSTELKIPAYADHRDLLGQIDAAIVAVPTQFHHRVASDLLQHGIHVFVEKPITLNIADADDLIAQAAKRRLTLQVGHVERFNPAFTAAVPHLHEPKYIDAVRSGPYTCRSTDVGVVLDLLIHDIDIALSLVDDEVTSIDAVGAPVIGPNEDWAQARLTFGNGCVANLFASRVAWQSQRSMHVICADGAATIDFAARQTKLMRVGGQIQSGQLDINRLDAPARAHLKDHLFDDYLPLTDLPTNKDANPLLEEQHSFIAAIHGQSAIPVPGSAGRAALDIAERILTIIASHQSRGTTVAPSIIRPPHFLSAPSKRRRAG
ncbi:MAG TPA: Gfo/Idh/MocA family oxidoreductase [Pirellulaceae bacterium]|jgi:predicted dehydrogenase